MPTWFHAAALLLVSALPAQGYRERVVAQGLDSPAGMTVTPDGRVFLAQQGGDLRVVQDDQLLPTPFVSVPTVANDEEGLIAVAVDPQFTANRFVYVVYTAQQPTRHNVLARYTAAGNVAAANSGTVLFDLDDNSLHFHIGGAIQFGADGKLYLGTGDNGSRPLAQSLLSTHGKVLRLNPDGTIPTNNAFYAQTTGRYRAVQALGFRNAYTLALQPGSGRLFVGEVGANSWEEIDELVAGGNYGWPTVEGPGGAPTFQDPLHSYPHTQGCALLGGAFYNPVLAQFPAGLVGRYFYADFCSNELRSIDPQSPAAYTVFRPTLAAGPVAVEVGPDGALWYLTRGNSQPTGGTGIPTGSLVKVTATPEPWPSSFTRYGNGCPGRVGVPAITATATPHLGARDLRLEVGNTSARAVTALLLGVSDRTSPLGALPLDLGFAGMPGCTLLTSGHAALVQFATAGNTAFAVPIPFRTSLVGLHLYVQAFVGEPQHGPADLAASAGYDLCIGL